MRMILVLTLSLVLFFPSAYPWAQGRGMQGGRGGGMHGGSGGMMGPGRDGGYGGMHSDGRYDRRGADMGRQDAMQREYDRETERLRNEMRSTREELNRETARENPDSERVDRLRRDLSDMRNRMDQMRDEYRRQMQPGYEGNRPAPGSE